MKIYIAEENQAHYAQGHLDYAISQLKKFTTIKEWQRWLKKEPIAYFDNKTEWTLRVNESDSDSSYDEIVYLEGTEEEEVYASTMVILLESKDMLCHSAEASPSFFFDCTNIDTNKLARGLSEPITAIYID